MMSLEALLSLVRRGHLGRQRDEALMALAPAAEKSCLPSLFSLWNGTLNDCTMEIISQILPSVTEEDEALLSGQDQMKLVRLATTIYHSRQSGHFGTAETVIRALALIGSSRSLQCLRYIEHKKPRSTTLLPLWQYVHEALLARSVREQESSFSSTLLRHAAEHRRDLLLPAAQSSEQPADGRELLRPAVNDKNLECSGRPCDRARP